MAIRTYKVTLDTKNAIAPEPVFLRQGDKTGAVVIDATLMDNSSPVSLSGLTPSFMANTADGQAVVSDTSGFAIVNASGGEFTYQVPSQLGSVSGKIKIAYFSFSDSSGAQSTFNVVFVVEKAADMTQESAKDWDSNLNKIINQYNQWVNNAHSDWQDFVNANKEIIESIDPGGTLLTEVIDARNGKSNLKTRLDDEHAQVTEQLAQKTQHYVSVKEFGAIGDGVADDTQAIRNAIASHTSIFFPKGRYRITDTLSFENKNLIGEQVSHVSIKADIIDPLLPAIAMGGYAILKNITVCYPDELITGNELRGERVGIRCYGGYRDLVLQTGGGIHNCQTTYCGTGITDGGKSVFSASFDDLIINESTFRGWDFYGRVRTGNVYKNIYINNHGFINSGNLDDYFATNGFNLEGEESECTIIQLNVEHMTCKDSAINLTGVRGLNITSAHIEGVGLADGTGSFVRFDKTSGEIGSFSIYYTRSHQAGQKLFDFKESQITNGPNTFSSDKASIRIRNLFLKGLNRPDRGTYGYEPEYPVSTSTLNGNGVQPFYFLHRDSIYSNPYEVEIENYIWYTWRAVHNDSDKYEEFLSDPNGNINYYVNYAQKEQKIGNIITIYNLKNREGIYLNHLIANGKTVDSITGEKSLTNPSTLISVVSPVVTVNGTNYPISKTLYSSPNGVCDNYDLVTGKYNQKMSSVVITSTSSITLEGPFFKIVGIPRAKDDYINGNSLCTHFPNRHYHLDYGVCYFSSSYIISAGIILSDDDNATKVSKLKTWLDAQQSNGNPVTLVYELETHAAEQYVDPQLISLNEINNISISDVNGTVTAGYDIATNKNVWYDYKLTKLENAIASLGGTV